MTQNNPITIWLPLRLVVALAALINLTVAFLFLIAPELGFSLWPSAVSSTISRFIGAIIFVMGLARPWWFGTANGRTPACCLR